MKVSISSHQSLMVSHSLWVPETVHTALDLLLRRQPATGMIRRWRYS
jgi:hypothetical protein